MNLLALMGTVTLLFSQPTEPGIAGRLLTPTANHKTPTYNQFDMVAWQSDPFTADGFMIPSALDVSVKTGVATTVSNQCAYQSVPNSTTVQVAGNTVGAYLNSADLPNSPAGQKMGIFPQYDWKPGIKPFVAPVAGIWPAGTGTSYIQNLFEMQIPYAVGKPTYVVYDMQFLSPTGVKISYGTKLFSNGEPNPAIGSAVDPASGSYMLNSPLVAAAPYVTWVRGNKYQSTTWTGFVSYEFWISYQNFAAALVYLNSLYPTVFTDLKPEDYTLVAAHFNAEFQFNPNPAELGWSMRNWQIFGGNPW